MNAHVQLDEVRGGTAPASAAAPSTSVDAAPIGAEDLTASPTALLGLRLAVLRALRGPAYRAAHHIPRRWPVLTSHVAGMARLLWEEGLLERTADGASGGAVPAYRATEPGLRALQMLEARLASGA